MEKCYNTKQLEHLRQATGDRYIYQNYTQKRDSPLAFNKKNKILSVNLLFYWIDRHEDSHDARNFCTKETILLGY